MKTYNITTVTKTMLADIITPVSVYLKIRDHYPNSILLESSDYHSNENSFSFICLQPVAAIIIDKGTITERFPDHSSNSYELEQTMYVPDILQAFIAKFKIDTGKSAFKTNGLFGYAAYDAVQHFESIQILSKKDESSSIPEIYYQLFKYVIAINHYKNELTILENLFEGEASNIDRIEELICNRNFATYQFSPVGEEVSPISNEDYKEMVKKGKEHCYRGDVFQIVLSRRFSQQYSGDDFNVYRALRSINPSPYLFYFDFGNFKIFGSSPEAQIIVKAGTAVINPIAGTFLRTGDDEADKVIAMNLTLDPKENAEHVMLVDLARNDLSRNSNDVKVETYREVQYYSHVIHLVSKVTGKLSENTNPLKVLGDTFPAGTLSGAPKHKAMQLIDEYETHARGYYGGGIGLLGFNGDINHAIMIRSFLSKNNTLFYQAGAGVVALSNEENELQEVNNKLAALKKAILLAKEF